VQIAQIAELSSPSVTGGPQPACGVRPVRDRVRVGVLTADGIELTFATN